MPSIAIATSRRAALADFTSELESHRDVELRWIHRGAEALALAKQSAPDLLIVDGDCADLPALDLLRQVMTINAMINLAMVSDLDEEDFHEATEGLGLLARLSPELGRDDASTLYSRLQAVMLP